ncbi:thioredoxin family protein [Nocardioides sp. Y6]|uniref:Thioredoxin family protein n=1 Tax=Nocardioides malaquae TaxID=2773426 RepID=A0ABR9RTC9_9ACTN|nr:thioredoxin family protein [Nocardioides malaquae]MBE7324848.1 thioredoxin family protein [Nocardioides malaquae]
MTTGQWILLAAVVAAVVFGVWRAATDGRFRGTHAVRGADGAPRRHTDGASGDTGRMTSEGHAPGRHTEDASGDTERMTPQGEAGTGSVVAGTEWAEALGERATLLQFSSAFCAPCRVTRRTLAEVAEEVPGVVHVEVDAESHLELVRRVGVMRTPTTLVLDATGREVTRAAGAPTKQQVLAALAAVD